MRGRAEKEGVTYFKAVLNEHTRTSNNNDIIVTRYECSAHSTKRKNKEKREALYESESDGNDGRNSHRKWISHGVLLGSTYADIEPGTPLTL